MVQDGLGQMNVVAIVFMLAGHIILRYTRFGHHIYMTGSNRQAAELSGVNTTPFFIQA